MPPLAHRIAWWLRDLFATCVHCGLRLPPMRRVRVVQRWRFLTCGDGEARWICAECYRNSDA